MTDTQAQEAARLAEALNKAAPWADGHVNHDAAALLRSQAARIAELEKAIERMTNNRDMWKGQCERQAAELARMREPLSAEALADKCEAWLQLGGATNVVDAFEAGYRECEAHGITKTGEQK